MLTQKRPLWLDKKISLKDCSQMKGLLRGLSLSTVCEEAACPNISECFSKGIATFMILGKACTRSCKFCNVEKGSPSVLDISEPSRVGEAVKKLKLKHVVITSVTRDDLKDGGAMHFAHTIKSVRQENGHTTIEVLIPDFKASVSSINYVAEACPDIINHNIETVPRLYGEIRPEADYRRSLKVLKTAKELSNGAVFTKSGIMLGLGEKEEEVLEVLRDLRSVGCDLLSIGQYLSPSKAHYPVKDYIRPAVFEFYKEKAGEFGFKFTASAPYVRSSYLADDAINAINARTR
jgi:lipoyl synthase